MKLLHSNNPWRVVCTNPRYFRVLSFSTTATSSKPTTSSDSSNTLYRRIAPSGDPRVSIIPILDQWIEEGRDIKQQELQRMVKQLRSYRRFKHALEMSEWMSKRSFDLSAGDVAVRLDLVSKVHGLEEAEKYFNSIPDSSRVLQVYGALLNSYAHSKCLEKAEDLMEKMNGLGFVRTSLPYNVMLNLYSRMGKYEKLDPLMQEMEEKGISCDAYTFTTRLSAYGAASDIDGMEKLLMKMEADPVVSMDWNSYVVAANGYIKTGLIEKASTALKKSEHLIRSKSRKYAHEMLLTLYTSMGYKDEVYRIWSLYRNMTRANTSGYLCMISSLVKLDDIEGAEKILGEWKSGNTCFDMRVPNLLVSAYCRKGLIEKAEALVNSLVESGKEPDASTWDRLAKGYYIRNQMAEAVETLKKAFLASRPGSGWIPDRATIAACLKFLKGKEDIKGAEEFIRLLSEQGHISTDTFNRLLSFIEDKDMDSISLDQMRQDDQAQDAEMQGSREMEYASIN